MLFSSMDFSDLKQKRKDHFLGGGEQKQEEHRKKGKLTAFERMNILFDSGTFVELDAFVTHNCFDFGMENKRILGDGVVTGYGTIDSRPTYAFSHDFTVLGGFSRIGIRFQSMQDNGSCIETRMSYNRDK